MMITDTPRTDAIAKALRASDADPVPALYSALEEFERESAELQFRLSCALADRETLRAALVALVGACNAPMTTAAGRQIIVNEARALLSKVRP